MPCRIYTKRNRIENRILTTEPQNFAPEFLFVNNAEDVHEEEDELQSGTNCKAD